MQVENAGHGCLGLSNTHWSLSLSKGSVAMHFCKTTGLVTGRVAPRRPVGIDRLSHRALVFGQPQLSNFKFLNSIAQNVGNIYRALVIYCNIFGTCIPGRR